MSGEVSFHDKKKQVLWGDNNINCHLIAFVQPRIDKYKEIYLFNNKQ